eukprot:gene5719-2113_t
MPAWRGLRPRAPDRNHTVTITGDRGFNGVNRTAYQLPPLVPRYAPNPLPLKVRRGERVCIRVVNHNAHPHPFHLHGHVFQVVEWNGTALAGPMRDTFLMLSGGCFSAVVCFDAD